METGLLKTLNTISESDKYNQWIYNNLKNYISGDILDIGSGMGDIVKYFSHNHTKKIIASDYSGEAVTCLQKKFSHLVNYDIIKMDISDDGCLSVIPTNSIDTITCLNVLEHIKYDDKAIINMHKILKQNGKLLLLVPALPWIYGSLDSLVGHFRRYDRKALNDLLQNAGFAIKKQHYMNAFGIITWVIAGKVLKRNSFDEKACRALNKIVPFLERLEKKLRPPIGQSLITICAKA